MVSLTTVYILSVILTSIAGIGSAFAGNKMIGGATSIDLMPEEPPQFTAPPSEEYPPSSTEQTLSEVQQEPESYTR